MAEDYTTEEKKPDDAEKAKAYLAQVLDREGKFKEGWWKRAEDSEKLYSQPNEGNPASSVNSTYNVLYSNTEVLLPSLYSATAKPDVRARFKDAKLAPIPQVLERFLTIFTDSAHPGLESFDDAVKDSVLSSLTAAMGCLRLKNIEGAEFPLQTESVGYKNLIWGKAKKWSRVPWIAFKHELSKAEFQKQLSISDEEMETKYRRNAKSDEKRETHECVVYEYWHKGSRTVWFISEDWQDVLIKGPLEDPLGLRGFFPTPGLLMLTLKPGALEPIPLYWYYKEQAEELNRVSTRLQKVLSAIRVRGAYNSQMSDELAKILSDTETENALVPAGESLALAQGGGFDKQIWLLPIEKLITVAQQLYAAREQIKAVIYELTGISDIIRGSNVASETATATSTKDKWGTLRLRKMQTVVANYIRDLFRLAVDAGTQVIPTDAWKRLTQLPIPTKEEQMVARQQIQFEQQRAQEAAMMAQQTGQPPQPPQPPNPQLQAAAAGPAMEEILQQISSDANRTFTINIQTSSTVDLDTAQDKAEVAEFMNAMGQMFSGLQPLMGLGPTGIETLKALLIAVCQRFKFGLPVVEIIEKLEPPPPPQPEPPPNQPSPAELQAIEAESQAKMKEIQARMALLDKEIEVKQTELDLKRQELQMKQQDLLRKEQLAQAQHQRDMLTASMPQPTVTPNRSRGNAPVRR